MAKEFDRISHISHVHIEGYKSIDNLDIDLLPGLNILIGKNGSGKSNFLEVVSDSFAKNYNPGPKRIQLNLKTASEKSIKWEYLNESTFIKDKLNLSSTVSLTVNDDSSSLYLSGLSINDTRWENGISDLRKNLIEFTPVLKIGFHLPKSFKDNLASRIIINILDYGQPNNFFWREMEALLIPIRGTKNISKDNVIKHLDFNKNLKSSLKRYSPISDIRFSPNFNIHSDDRVTSIENIYPEFKISGNWVPWSYLSDGTKRLFYLIYSVCQYSPAIILIEEPELGVHPHQFFDIMAFLKEESWDKQIIISTHSPEALNILGYKDLERIILTTYSSKSGTKMKHLSSAQKNKAKDYMKEVDSLSEYWKHFDLEKR